MRASLGLIAIVAAAYLAGGTPVSVNVCPIGGKGSYLTSHVGEERLRYLDVGLQTESAGAWHGAGSRHFGLEGRPVEAEAFENLLQGFSPDRSAKLTQNAGSEKRALGWEVVVAPHKSVSDLLAVLPPEMWHQLLACHDDAVREVARCMEKFCGVSRRGKGGATQESAGLIVGEHLHLTNRENEPQIHTHLTVMNAALRADGTFGSLVSKNIYKLQRVLNSVYQQTLARHLRQRLGVVCDRDRFAARVRGVPEAFIQATSTRSAQIDAAAGPPGSRSAKEAEVAARATRKEKDLRPVSALAREWAKLAERSGFTWGQVVRRPCPALTQGRQEKHIHRAIREAARGLVADSPVFDRWQLLTRTLTNLIGKDVAYTQVMAAVRQALDQPRDFGLVDLGEVRGEKAYTTRGHMRLEERLVGELEKLAGHPRPLVRTTRIEKVLAGHPDLREEQQKAVRKLTEGGRLSVLTGYAGTGKTKALRAVKEVLEAPIWKRRTLRPHEVIGCAVSGRAADTLQADTGIPSMTVAKLLEDLRPTPLVEVFWAVRRIQFGGLSNLLRYAAAVRRPKLVLDRNTTVVLDEASLVSTKDLLELAWRVNKSGARLILVGDPAQMQAIGPSGGLDLVINRFPQRTAALCTIQRQEAAWEREAVKDIVQGDAKKAVQAYEREGKLTVAADVRSAHESAVKLYVDGGGLLAPKDHLLLANTNGDIGWLNHLVQDARSREGLLEGAPLRLLSQSGRGQTDFYVGDRILFLRNATFAPPRKEPLPEQWLRAAVDPLRRAVAERLPDWARVFVEPQQAVRVRNGQFGTVLAVAPQFSRLLIGLDTGERVVVNAARYPHLALGYATTVFKSQSTTVNHVYALLAGGMTDRESGYVAVSRGRLSTNLVIGAPAQSPELASASQADASSAIDALIRQVQASHKQSTAIERQRLAEMAARGHRSMTPPPPPQQQPEQGLGR